jgi:hypothetical protein
MEGRSVERQENIARKRFCGQRKEGVIRGRI